MDYEWDPAKNQSNIEKHGIDFNDILSFFDSQTWGFVDTRQPYGEIRWRVYGEVGPSVLCVIYTEREGKKRIISARKTNPRERKIYYAKRENRLG